MNDISIIGVGKDAYNDDLPGMVEGRILPWVEDTEDDGYPVWTDYGAVQRSTYFFDRDGQLVNSMNITQFLPENPNDYSYLINYILDLRSENGPAIFRVPEDTISIQGAIELAENGDIILISPGTYREKIDFLDKNITVASLFFSEFDPFFIGETILDGDTTGTVVTIAGGQDHSAILIGLTIENGYSDQTGGGVLIDHADPILDRNIIRNNHAGSCGGEGGGVAIINESYPYLFGNDIYNNEVSGVCDCVCYFGGGIYVDSTSWSVVGGSVTIGNRLYSNYADYGMQLFRQPPADTLNWTPIFAHHNQFEICPPDFPEDVFPENGWDLENCHTLGIGYDIPMIPDKIFFHQNYPNPFNPRTYFMVSSHNETEVELKVFDIKGRMIEVIFNGILNSGSHHFQWYPKNHPAGLYFIHLSSNESKQTRKAIYVK